MRLDAAALEDFARDALASGEEDAALVELQPAAAATGSARLWQWTGLLQRALDRHADAMDSFAYAARLAPDDGGIAHGHAQIALEAGLPATALFDTARRLNPASGEVLTGQAAARLAAGDGQAAIDGLAAVLADNPGWIDGHRAMAQLHAMLKGKAAAGRSFARAAATIPGHFPLWQGWIATLLDGELYTDAIEVVRNGRRQFGTDPYFDLHEAIALSEQGDTAAADPLFDAVPMTDAGSAVWRVRHLIRTGRIDAARSLIEMRLDPDDPAMWPYAAIAWRLTGDPRAAWLDGDPALVSVVDLRGALPPLDRLAAVLRGLHVARGEHLDQSVRGGTQTDGPLLSQVDPDIRKLRAAVVAAVATHVAQLPPLDPRHPTLSKRRDRAPRFAGSWSVRLTAQGHHANHVHPQGWLSSALYVALPDEVARGGGEAGWLTLGQPQAALGLDLPPVRTIEPKPGRLVLFPSTMWHGTMPFADGERLTVAFDVAPPR